jgi:hypothetical protein
VKKLYYLLAAALVGSTLSLVGASPAQAVTYVDIQADNVRLRSGECVDVPIYVSGDWVDGGITVTVTDPDGYEVGYDYQSDTTGSIESSYYLCGSDTPGWYGVDVTVDDFNDVTAVSGHDSFSLTRIVPVKKAARVDRAIRWKSGKHAYLAAGRLTRAGHAYKGKPVEIQARIQGTWMKIDTARTARKGLFGWWIQPNRFTWRFAFRGDATTRADVSRAFRTPQHGRVVARVAGGDPISFLAQR